MIKNFFNEFKKFAMRGNVMDMAVGIIIGAAFGKIVTSLVEDVIMPPIGWALGKVDFSDLAWNVADGVTIKYGAFINTVISFIIVAFAVFILIKAVNTLQAKMLKEEEDAAAKAAPTTKKCPYCCSEVAIEATKCPYCTSELKAETKAKTKTKAKSKK